MLYEAFMAEYGLLPDQADERFSMRQMLLLLEARNRRKRNEAKILAYEIWVMGFGEQSGGKGKSNGTIVRHKESKSSFALFGISAQKGG